MDLPVQLEPDRSEDEPATFSGLKEGASKLLAKARRAIDAARILLAGDGPEFASGRAYYAMFYIAEASLHERGERFRRHSAVHAAYGKIFAKTGLLDSRFHRWLLRAFEARLENDYGFDATASEAEVREMVEQARTFLVAASEFLDQSPQIR